MIYRIMEWNGGITLAELNRRSRIKIYIVCSTKPRWTDLDFFLNDTLFAFCLYIDCGALWVNEYNGRVCSP